MPESFWNSFSKFFLNHQQFSFLLIFLFGVLILLWHRQLMSRKAIIPALVFFIVSACCFLLSALFTGLAVNFANLLYQIAILTSGIAIIRVIGSFLFQIILPLCRVNLLSIIEDIVEFAAYCAWTFIYLHQLGLQLSDIITTSAVMTAILAFAMQDTLGNIIGGLALQLDDSIKVGDWIKMEDINGRVSDIRWRYTAIETRNWETVIVPNSLLMKGKLFVIGRRVGQPLKWRRWVYFEVDYQYSSTQVINIAQQAVRDGRIFNVSNMPEANCVIMDFTAHAIRYAVRYWLIDIEIDDATDSSVRLRIRAALQRAGIDMAYPRLNLHLTNQDDKYEHNKQLKQAKEKTDALRQIELFHALNEEEINEIADQLVFTPFVQGDVIMRQGEVADWLYIIIKGTIEVLLEMPDGASRYLDTIQDGNILGEMGLMTGNPRSATAIAKTEVLAYRLDKPLFQKVLDNRPEIAVEISNLLVSRRFSIENLQQLDKASAEKLMEQAQKNFLKQIRNFFGL
ncbi:CRP-like cAMP-activated global transcriptional regulator [Patescibacteria group bacterium]|nr:CRP-like cAMP-activated global transcriptional regulator [Patescibacteria group bacterium]